jgi:hypothetical protein
LRTFLYETDSLKDVNLIAKIVNLIWVKTGTQETKTTKKKMPVDIELIIGRLLGYMPLNIFQRIHVSIAARVILLYLILIM